MPIGSFTQQFDLVNLLLVLFVAFFLCLIYYLRQEDKREGYPLVSHRSSGTGGRVEVVGFPPMPKPKVFHRPHGRPPVYAPRLEELPPIDADNVGNLNGRPIIPHGNAMLSGTGAGAWVAREDEPELDYHGDPLLRPFRAVPEFRVMRGDPDPRGFVVVGHDKVIAGRVVDVWILGGEHYAQFLEVELAADILDQRSIREPYEEEDSEAEREVVAVAVTTERFATPGGTVEVTEVDVVTAPAQEQEQAEESHHEREEREHPHHDEWTERVEQDEAEARAPQRGRVLLPLSFASVNGRAGVVHSAAITAAQFANVPGRKKDLTITAREEQQIRAYYGSGYLWSTPDRLGPLL